MTDRPSNPDREKAARDAGNVTRRRAITGLGAVAAGTWLSGKVAAQGTRESDILIIGGGMAGSATAFQLASRCYLHCDKTGGGGGGAGAAVCPVPPPWPPTGSRSARGWPTTW